MEAGTDITALIRRNPHFWGMAFASIAGDSV
jgi:hypothetical protein